MNSEDLAIQVFCFRHKILFFLKVITTFYLTILTLSQLRFYISRSRIDISQFWYKFRVVLYELKTVRKKIINWDKNNSIIFFHSMMKVSIGQSYETALKCTHTLLYSFPPPPLSSFCSLLSLFPPFFSSSLLWIVCIWSLFRSVVLHLALLFQMSQKQVWRSARAFSSVYLV